jgi:hypothetical protein
MLPGRCPVNRFRNRLFLDPPSRLINQPAACQIDNAAPARSGTRITGATVTPTTGVSTAMPSQAPSGTA